MKHERNNPLDYQSQPSSSIDPDISTLWWVRLANRRRGGRSPLFRLIYYVVFLSLIAGLLWYIRSILGPLTGVGQ
jgi:hypothetical protein